MYEIKAAPRFERDVKKCIARGWNRVALAEAIGALSKSDEEPLPINLRDHKLKGEFAGYRSIHIDSTPNPPRNKWVLMYATKGEKLVLVRTGSHDEVYGTRRK